MRLKVSGVASVWAVLAVGVWRWFERWLWVLELRSSEGKFATSNSLATVCHHFSLADAVTTCAIT